MPKNHFFTPFSFRFFCLFCLFPGWLGLAQGADDAFPAEPKSQEEFAAMVKAAVRSVPCVYVVRSGKLLEWNGQKSGAKTVRATIFASSQAAREAFSRCEIPRGENEAIEMNAEIGPASAEASARMRLRRGVARPFFFSRWEGEPIGSASFERKLGMWESDPTASVCFLRGNCVITVSSGFNSRYGEPDANGHRELEFFPISDPRAEALAIDRQLRKDPLEALTPAERERLQTLNVELAPKERWLGIVFADFSRRLPDGTEPDEIRLVVSPGGAVRQDFGDVPHSGSVPSLYPDPAGKFVVDFMQPLLQTVRCFHLDRDGKVLAWGEAKAMVQDSGVVILKSDTAPRMGSKPRPNPNLSPSPNSSPNPSLAQNLSPNPASRSGVSPTFSDVPNSDPYEGLRPKFAELSSSLAKEFRPIFDGMSGRGFTMNEKGEITDRTDYGLWEGKFFLPLFAKSRQGMIRLVGTDDCLALWEDGRAVAMRRIEKTYPGSPEADFSLWLTFNRAVTYANRGNFLKGTKYENQPIPGAYSGYSPESGWFDASWEALAVFSFRNEQARRVLTNIAVQEPGRWCSEPLHRYAAYFLTLCPNAEELLPTLRALLEEEIANARQSSPETAKIILTENDTVVNPFYYSPKNPDVKINGVSFAVWYEKASVAFPRLFGLAGLIHSLEFNAMIPPEERERFDVFRREYALSWAMADKRRRPLPPAFTMPLPGDERFLKYLEHFPPLGPVADRFWSPGFESTQPQSVTEVPTKLVVPVLPTQQEMQRPFREADERFSKILLTESDLEGSVSLKSGRCGSLAPASSVWPASPGFRQVATWEESGKQMELRFMLFPDSDYAREGLRIQLRTVKPQFEPVTSEVRSAMGLTEKERAFVFREGMTKTFLIQSGALLFQAQLVQVSEPAPLLRIVLERWRACAPQEVQLPEERKTLEVFIEGKDWETDTRYPIFMNSRSDSAEVFVPFQPRRLRFELIPPDAEDLAAGPDRQRPDGGFSVERHRSFQDSRRLITFDGSDPPFFFVTFAHPGRHVIRRILSDFSGNILAWGEMEVNVREKKEKTAESAVKETSAVKEAAAEVNSGTLFSANDIRDFVFSGDSGPAHAPVAEAQLAAFLQGLTLPDGLRLANCRKIVPVVGNVGFLRNNVRPAGNRDVPMGASFNPDRIPRYEACFRSDSALVLLQVIACESLRDARFMMLETLVSAPKRTMLTSMMPLQPWPLLCREKELGDDLTLSYSFQGRHLRFLRKNHVFILSLAEDWRKEPGDFDFSAFAKWFDGQLETLFRMSVPEGDFSSFWKSGTGLPEDGMRFQKYLWESEQLAKEFLPIRERLRNEPFFSPDEKRQQWKSRYFEPLFEKARAAIVRVAGSDDLITLWEQGLPQQFRTAGKRLEGTGGLWKAFLCSILSENQDRILNGTEISLPWEDADFCACSDSWDVVAIFSLGTERARDFLLKLALDEPERRGLVSERGLELLPELRDLAAYFVTLSLNAESLLPQLKTTLRREIAYLREHKTASRNFIDGSGRVLNPFRCPPENPEAEIGGLPWREWMAVTQPFGRIFRRAGLVHSLEFNTKIPSAERERFAALRREYAVRNVFGVQFAVMDQRKLLLPVMIRPAEEHFLTYFEEYPALGFTAGRFWKPEPEEAASISIPTNSANSANHAAAAAVAPAVSATPSTAAVPTDHAISTTPSAPATNANSAASAAHSTSVNSASRAASPESGVTTPFLPEFIREANVVYEKIRLLESDLPRDVRLNSRPCAPLVPLSVSVTHTSGFLQELFNPGFGGVISIQMTLFAEIEQARTVLLAHLNGTGGPFEPLSAEGRSGLGLTEREQCFICRSLQGDAEVLFIQSGRLLIRCRTPWHSPAISPLRTILMRLNQLPMNH